MTLERDLQFVLEQEPSLISLKFFVDELLNIENGIKERGNYTLGNYPSVDVINNIWVLLVKATKGKIFKIGTNTRAVFGGIAISPDEAMNCISDYIRTARFIAGVCAAIKEAQGYFPGEKIRIIDNGCGPLAILSIAAMSQFSPDEVEFTLIDIFDSSLDCVKEIIKTLGLERYCRYIMQYDAACIKLPEKQHVIIAEVIDRALTSENQVPIVLNMLPQLMDNGLIVPEMIVVDACLKNQDKVIVLGRVAEITKDVSLEALGVSAIHPVRGIETTHRFPLPLDLTQGNIYLSTAIRVFGNYQLKPDETAITTPFNIGSFQWDNVQPRYFTLHTTFGGLTPQKDIRGSIQ